MAVQKRYTEEEQIAALELGATMGRRAAVRHLGISPHAFQRWTEKHAKLWSDLRAQDPEVQKQQYARRLEDLAEDAMAVEHDAIARASSLLKDASAKDTAALLKGLSTSRATAVAGGRATRGEPDIHEHNINFPDLEAAMERLLGGGAPPALPVRNEAEAK